VMMIHEFVHALVRLSWQVCSLLAPPRTRMHMVVSRTHPTHRAMPRTCPHCRVPRPHLLEATCCSPHVRLADVPQRRRYRRAAWPAAAHARASKLPLPAECRRRLRARVAHLASRRRRHRVLPRLPPRGV
jgi:hypothetical protein